MTKHLPAYAPVVLRFALVLVYIWFAVSQITNAAAWVGLVPSWATGLSGLNAETIVNLNGWFEVVAGTLLALGVRVRWVAALLFLHLLVITAHLGFTAVGVRDFGLSFATLAVALYGDDMWSLTYKGEQAPAVVSEANKPATI